MSALESPKVVHPDDKAAYYEGGARRQEREEIGRAGEERVAAVFDKHFGKVSRSIDFHSTGTNFYPDLVINTVRGRYAVEVKTTLPYFNQAKKNMKKASVHVNRESWEGISRFARGRLMKRMLVIEERVQGSKKGHVYYCILGEVVDAWMGKSNAKDWVHFSLYDAPALCAVAFRPGLDITVDKACMIL